MRLEILKETVKVVQLSDIHLSYPIAEKSKAAISAIIDHEEPDLVVISGDLFHTHHSRKEGVKLVMAFIEYFDEFKVNYTYCFGNHDEEINLRERDIYNLFTEYSTYFIGEIGPEEITLYHPQDHKYRDERIGNFVLTVTMNDEPKFELALLDSGRYNVKGDYGSLTDIQIEYLKEQISKGEVPLFVFFHIPLKAHEEYYEEYLIDGIRREKDYPQPDEHGMLDMLLNCNREVYLYCGHDHLNNYSLKYNNVTFGITPGLCYEEYCDDQVRGYRVFTIGESITNKTVRVTDIMQ